MTSPIDSYIAKFPPDISTKLESIRQILHELAPDVVETFSYQMPTFKLHGKNLVHIAAWKQHIGFYPTPAGFEGFEEELQSYTTSKGAVQFPLDTPLPLDLIRRMIAQRISYLHPGT